MRRSSFRRTVWMFLGLLLAPLALRAEDAKKIAFESHLKPGDKWLVTADFYLDLNLRTLDVEGNPKDRTVVRQRSERYVRTFVDVTEGKPTREQIEFIYSREGESQSTSVPVTFIESTLSGKTVMLWTEGKKTEVSDLSGGKIDQAELSSVKLDEEFAALLPPHPVAVNERWEPAKDQIVKLAIGGRASVPAEGSVLCKLKAVENVEGRQIAVVSIDLQQLKQSPRPGYGMTLNATNGEFRFDLMAGRPLSLTLSGTYVMTGSEKDVNEATIADMKGTGKWTCSITCETAPEK